MRFLTSFLACVFVLIACPSWAEVLYNLTFDSPPHQVGQRPAIGAGPARVSGIVFGSPRVVNDQPLLDGNCLEFEGYANYEQISLDLLDVQGRIAIDFDIVTENMIDSLYGFTVLLDTPIVRTLSFHGPLEQLHAFMPWGGGFLQPFVDGRKYHVTMNVDTMANTWMISVDGVQRYAYVSHSQRKSRPMECRPGDPIHHRRDQRG